MQVHNTNTVYMQVHKYKYITWKWTIAQKLIQPNILDGTKTTQHQCSRCAQLHKYIRFHHVKPNILHKYEHCV